MRWFPVLAACAAFTFSCAGAVVTIDGIEVYAKVWDRAKQELGRRAAAELNCGVVDFTLIRREGRDPVEVLVVGCGRRGMYVKPTAHMGGYRAVGSWQLSTVSADPGSVTPPSPPALPSST